MPVFPRNPRSLAVRRYAFPLSEKPLACHDNTYRLDKQQEHSASPDCPVHTADDILPTTHTLSAINRVPAGAFCVVLILHPLIDVPRHVRRQDTRRWPAGHCREQKLGSQCPCRRATDRRRIECAQAAGWCQQGRSGARSGDAAVNARCCCALWCRSRRAHAQPGAVYFTFYINTCLSPPLVCQVHGVGPGQMSAWNIGHLRHHRPRCILIYGGFRSLLQYHIASFWL